MGPLTITKKTEETKLQALLHIHMHLRSVVLLVLLALHCSLAQVKVPCTWEANNGGTTQACVSGLTRSIAATKFDLSKLQKQPGDADWSSDMAVCLLVRTCTSPTPLAVSLSFANSVYMCSDSHEAASLLMCDMCGWKCAVAMHVWESGVSAHDRSLTCPLRCLCYFFQTAWLCLQVELLR